MPSDALNLPLIPTIAPFESMQLPSTIDGRDGSNRATGNHPQIAATNDIDAITAWLARFVDTRTTFGFEVQWNGYGNLPITVPLRLRPQDSGVK